MKGTREYQSSLKHFDNQKCLSRSDRGVREVSITDFNKVSL